MKFTQIPQDTFKNLQMGAGVLLKSFNPTEGTLEAGGIIGATSGGVNFTAVPTYSDLGEDIDNCPKNMKELKRLDSWEVKMSGTFVSVTPATTGMLTGPADVEGTKVTPRNDLKDSDFTDLWWVGDYSEVNEDGAKTGKAGFVAVHMMNSLSTGGYAIQSSDKAKGQFAFEFTGHYSMSAQDTVPFEVYTVAGTADEAAA